MTLLAVALTLLGLVGFTRRDLRRMTAVRAAGRVVGVHTSRPAVSPRLPGRPWQVVAMKVLILTLGTCGDIQPLIALRPGTHPRRPRGGARCTTPVRGPHKTPLVSGSPASTTAHSR